jgi:hypothetical protein
MPKVKGQVSQSGSLVYVLRSPAEAFRWMYSLARFTLRSAKVALYYFWLRVTGTKLGANTFGQNLIFWILG